MPVRNAHWYSQNEGRSYPLDDTATALADDGYRLPPNILVDMNLRWPSTLGRYAFVTAVSNTPAAVTLTIQAANAPDDTSSFAPLAVLTVRKPIDEGRMYALLPQLAGVAGWVVFGSGADDRTYRGRFSTPAQGLLALRAARAYRPLPVSSLQAQYAAEKLTGVVTLKATAPLQLTKEERLLGGALRDCVVVRLVDGEGVEGFQTPADTTTQTSVFRQFAGPCAGRPESNTCGCPEPIQFVNAVPPDCNGKLTVEFLGCAQVAQILEKCGVAVACQFGLVDACLPAQIPSSEGLLPREYYPANDPVPPEPPPDPADTGVSDSLSVGDLPLVACFTGGSVDLTLVTGVWDVTADDTGTDLCPTEQGYSASVSYSLSESDTGVSDSYWTVPLGTGSLETTSAASRSVAILEGDVQSVFRKATTEVKLLAGPTGAKRNAQMVINYRPHATVDGQFVYFAAEVDYDTQTFRLLRFNGTVFQTVAPASVVLPGIQLDKWFKIETTVVPSGIGGDVTITCRLTSVTDPGVTDVSLSATVSNYQPSTGAYGIGTSRALARFAYLKVEQYGL